MTLVRRWLFALVVLLTAPACAPPAASENSSDAGRRAPCEQWGPIGVPWAEGTSAVRSYGEPGPFLLGFPDAVEGETPEGDKVPCSLFREGAYYHCNSEGDLQTIAVSLQGKRWSWPAKCPYYEDGVRLDLDDVPFCVDPETIVAEGKLLGVDPARRPPEVTLEGPWQVFETSSDSLLAQDSRSEGSVPGVACTVHDGHFSCPSLGFRTTAQHRVVAGGVRTEVSLPVADCRASAVTLSIRCPVLPAGFYVEVPEPLRFREPILAVNRGAGPQHQVEASYEGGATYPCVPEPDPVYKDAADATYFCPAAPGNEWGRGRYDIVAVPFRTGERYVGSVSDPFDGCGGTGAPFQLTPEGARDNQ